MREAAVLNRFIVRADGSLVIVDPRPSDLELITDLVPDFTIQQEPLPGFVEPRLRRTRRASTGLALASVRGESTECLRNLLDRRNNEPLADDEASILDLKVELAHRMLSRCALCGLRCEVDRLSGETGRCGLGAHATVYESYLHVAEEAPINPSLNLSLRGCGMRCRYCQQFPALVPRGEREARLNSSWWERLDFVNARSLSFIGGNPTESLPAILQFLRSAPDSFNLPIVWNSSGYDTVEAIGLLDGIADCYVPDCKYGNEGCADTWSRSPGYVRTMRAAIEEMVRQAVPVYVRLLVLPGHVDCCHLPALDLLWEQRHRITVHVMAQYQPTFLISARDGAMASEVPSEEVERVINQALKRGFHLTGAAPVAARSSSPAN